MKARKMRKWNNQIWVASHTAVFNVKSLLHQKSSKNSILIDWVVFKKCQSVLGQQLSTQAPPEALGIFFCVTHQFWSDTSVHPPASACSLFAATATARLPPPSPTPRPSRRLTSARWSISLKWRGSLPAKALEPAFYLVRIFSPSTNKQTNSCSYPEA